MGKLWSVKISSKQPWLYIAHTETHLWTCFHWKKNGLIFSWFWRNAEFLTFYWFFRGKHSCIECPKITATYYHNYKDINSLLFHHSIKSTYSTMGSMGVTMTVGSLQVQRCKKWLKRINWTFPLIQLLSLKVFTFNSIFSLEMKSFHWRQGWWDPIQTSYISNKEFLKLVNPIFSLNNSPSETMKNVIYFI